MVAPINSLMNMEYTLYGGASGFNPACPSFTNGYMANRNAWNTSFHGYQKGITPYGQNNTGFNANWNSLSSGMIGKQAENAAVKAATLKDLDTLGNYYLKGLSPSESIMGAATGGAAFAFAMNPRIIAHPWNYFVKATGNVEKMFADVKVKGSGLNALWNNKKGGYELLTEAYSRMHKLESLNNSKLGLFRKSIKGVKDASGKEIYSTLKTMMEDALRSGEPEKIARATEEIKRATNKFSGHIPNLLRKCGLQKPLTGLRKLINPSHYQAIEEVVTKNIAENGGKSLTAQLKHGLKGQGGLGGLVMMAIEFFMDKDKIAAAFKKDTETGMEQLGQTTIKGAGTLIGWAAGEAVGTWAGAKLGAAAGTLIAPGVGTVIGAIAGLVGGSIGCALLGKLTHKIVGDDVGSKVEVAQMKATPQGQAKLLEVTLAQAQSDKNLDPNVALALQNVAAQYT